MDDFKFDILDVANCLNLSFTTPIKAETGANCPFCGDTGGHLSLNLTKNVYRCNRCERFGSMLHLYAEVMHTDTKVAWRKMMEFTGSDTYQNYKTEIVAKIKHQEVCEIAHIEKRDRMYRALLGQLNLGEFHLRNLTKRGLSEMAISSYGYKSLPATPAIRLRIVDRLVKEFGSLKGIPGFFVNKYGEWDMLSPAGFLVPVRDINARIQGFQIRLNDETEKKYCWFSSKDMNLGTPAKGWIHWPIYQKKHNAIYLTEGGLKADVACFLSNGKPFLAVPGVKCRTQLQLALEDAKKKGIDTIVESFDSDKYTNVHVKNALLALEQLVVESGLKYVPFSWDVKYKGIDDYLLARCGS